MSDNQSTPEKMNSFTKGMVKDSNDTYIGEGVWSHARNLVNNSHDGQTGVVGNEPSNILCVNLPYTLIGCIPLIDNEWAIFTTNDIDSEIGVFNELMCTYERLVNSKCLGFNRKHLITGASRRTFDCSVKFYWADGNNVDRVMDRKHVPWKQICTTSASGCVTCVDTTELDCERLRLAPLLTVPCLRLEKATGSGTLPNGTYQVAVAYMVNEIKVTDYLIVSNPVSIWSHSGIGGAIVLSVNNTDPDFTEMEVVVISVVNAQTVAKQLGVYSTHQGTIYIDNIDPTLVTVPLANIPLITPALEKSDGIFSLGTYLLKTGIYTKPDFNYQPLANQIVTKWVKVKYPADYYHKGGANVGNMRDEVYPYFIRWVYNTGDRSASYHIPGVASGTPASTNNISGVVLSDGGIPVQEGLMDYWESTEKYPDTNPTVWNSFPLNSSSVYNLCGANIRHHKFPDNSVIPHFENGGDFIYVLGVKFSNITQPKDINGQPIKSIVGYEILRGSREGHKSVIAKGMVNNMKQYNIVDASTGSATGQTAIMQNYPYNDISANDPFYESVVGTTALGNYVSFHSPDTTFQNPYIGQVDLKTYGSVFGRMIGGLENPYKHPEFKIVGQRTTDVSNGLATILALTKVLSALTGGTITLASTEDMPYSTNLISPITSPDLSILGTNALGAAIYAINLGLNAGIVVAWELLVGIKIDAQKIISIITGIIPTEQYGKQFNSHGYYNYNNFISVQTTAVEDYGYIKDSVQSLGGKTINNLYRNPYVALKLTGNNTAFGGIDNSLSSIIDSSNVTRNICSNYGALKVNILSQYGQIDSIRQIPISSCIYKYTESPILFGGDTYINRYTEKNQYLFFNDWLIDQPSDYVYNYLFYQNIVGTQYFVDNRKQYVGNDNSLSVFIQPFKLYRLRQSGSDIGKGIGNGSGWRVEPGNFYLSCNGVRDFFVESEVNVGYRDWDDEISKRFYDPYGFTDLSGMFRSDIIKYSSAFYKYDYSLSVSRMYNQFISWGSVLPLSFNPQLAVTCYSYYPRRINYSLPQQEELKRDNWQSFLVNNYKDMEDEITCVKSINKTGALIMLRSKSPIQLMGTDSLQTSTGIKVTIGDGGLFNQALQSVVNSDEIYQYGSCQNRWSITSTPQGVFYVSQDQGKVFLYTGQLQEISRMGMKWWFSRYLPSNLKKLFPNYADGDNTVIGSGVSTVYDNINEILYITKRDYIPKRQDIKYDPIIGFYIDGDPTQPYAEPYSPTKGFGCPDGYSLVDGVCTQITSVEASPVTTSVALTSITSAAYGIGGTLIYKPGWAANTGVGPYTNIGFANSFWVNNIPQATVAVASTDGALSCGASTLIAGQYISITGTNTGTGSITGYTSGTIYKISSVDGFSPNIMLFKITTPAGGAVVSSIGTLVGLTYNSTIGPVNGLITSRTSGIITYTTYLPDVPSKTYYVAVTGFASNMFSIILDDVYILRSSVSVMLSYLGATPESKYLHIYPITVSDGPHTISISGDYKGLGTMVIDNTFNEIVTATSYSKLNILFTSKALPTYDDLDYDPAVICPTDAYVVEKIPGDEKCDCSLTETTDFITPSLNIVPSDPLPTKLPIKLCDGSYFEDASWTISYDVKNNEWISFHDWHPTFMLPAKRHFLTAFNACGISQTGIWRHNDRWDDFCNFYGTYYPFEIEFVIPTGDTVTTMKNVEYVLEAYKYGSNGQDKFHLLDYNFDEAIVYNSEQISGPLNLNLKSKSNPFMFINYPIINATGSTDILYSKEEQKYRFNQFNDIVKDRGEFSGAENILVTTSPNGYTWNVNPFSVDYYKAPLQRKKFRHNVGKVLLRKKAVGRKNGGLEDGGIKILFKMIKTKIQISQK